MTRRPLGILVFAFVATALCAPLDAAPPNSEEFFEKQIRPLLVAKCYKCHSAEAATKGKLKGKFRLDTREGLRKGGESGKAIVPGKPGGGTLLAALRYEELEMPPDAPLTAQQIALVEQWIRHGAVDPRKTALAADPKPINIEEGRKHWSYQPIRKPGLPKVENEPWSTDPMDRFVLARLEGAGLAPSSPADKRTWLRRVTFDLIGLPPTYEEVGAFVADESPTAKQKIVDRLLASPHYGERWARHWLDVARYADSRGYIGVGRETRYPFAYTYRDYVVQSLNDDKPYDRFVLEQLAADQIKISEDKSELAAMGLLTAGHRFLNRKHLAIDQTIDVITRGLLGLTVTCARCHDHKYDPILADDYYSLYGILASGTEPGRLPVIGTRKKTPEYQAYVKKLEALRADIDRYDERMVAPSTDAFRNETKRYLVRIAAELPGASKKDIPQAISKASFRYQGIERWRRYLESARSRRDPVFAPWHALASLPRAQFATKAAQLITRWQKKPSIDGVRINPLIVRVLADQPPAHMVDVALTYAKLLASTNQKWKAALAAKGDKPTQLSGAAQEQLRQVLYGPTSPCLITRKDVKSFFNTKQRDERKKVVNRLEQHEIDSPGAPPRAMVLYDQGQPHEPRIFIRGNPDRHGKTVVRRYLRVLSQKPSHEKFTTRSGRLELARAIASKDNPLTARVMVNRVWQHHFGHGLVRTPSDFGMRGERPTHPELLDHLAATFIADGWSLKRLHRRIVLSRTYGQASATRDEAVAKDTDNRLLWHYPRRRLEFEPLRDSLLAVAGNLDRRLGGRGINIFKHPASTRRSLYAEVRREEIPTLLRAFDVANPNISTAVRTHTTVPQQSLFLMNSQFVLGQANLLSARATKLTELDSSLTWVHAVFRLALARDPDTKELKISQAFLQNERDRVDNTGVSPRDKFAQALLQANEFMFVD